MPNLFSDIPQSLPKELYTDLLSSPHVRIERIVSHGHVSTPGKMYQQDRQVWVSVLKGAAQIGFENGTVKMRPGDFVRIPALQKHRIDWTTTDEHTIWLAVHYGASASQQPSHIHSGGNLFTKIPQSLPDELLTPLIEAEGVRIERIVSHGHASPAGFWYDQEENEFVLLVQGAARLRFEDSVVDMNPGDWINIPTHQKHRVDWTTPDEPTIWLAVFY